MKIVYYSEDKNLKKIIYYVSILKNLKKDIYVFLNNFDDVEKLKKIKEKAKINFIISKNKINKIIILKILKERLKDDILFIEGSLNFNIKKLKDIDFTNKNIKFVYKSRILKILDLCNIDRISFYKKNNKDEIEEIDLEFFIDKQFIIDVINNFKRNLKNTIKLVIKLLEKKIIKDLINEKIGFIFLKFFTFLLMIFLSRFLTIELYGRYVNFHSLVISLAAVISLSIPMYKFFIEKKEERAEYIVNTIFLLFFNSLIIFCISIIFKDFFLIVFNTRNILLILILLITSFLFVIRYLFAQLFFADLKLEINKYFDILEGLFKFIFVLLLSFLSPTKGVIIGIFLAFLILDIIEFLFIRKFYPDIIRNIKIKIDLKKIKDLVKHGLSINYSNMILSFYSSFRFSLISYIKGLVEVSLYFNALNVVSILSSLFSIYNIILPRIVKWSKQELKIKLKKLIFFQFIIYSILFIFLIVFSEKIIILLFGEKYILASKYLKYSSILLFILPLGIFYNVLWLKTYLKEVSIINLVYLISFISLDIILIPKIGIIGAILSNILSTLFYYLVSFIFFKIKI